METKERIRIVVAVCVLLAGITALAPGKIIYVDDDATGANDGSAWADAFTYLQDALAAAQAGDEIHIAQGVYKPDQGAQVTAGDRKAVFSISGGAVLRGGYAGLGASDPNVRNAELYQTVLSGDLKGDDAEVQYSYELEHEPARAENSERIVRIGAGRATVVLDGCTMTGATQGATESEDADVAISNCTFAHNATREKGGAIRSGGGDLTLSCCTFMANWALDEGGAVYADAGCFVQLTECNFTDNQASSGGAVACEGAEATMTDCAFDRNAAPWHGGAMQCTAGTLLLGDCVFRQNSANLRRPTRVSHTTNWGEGGALALYNTRGASCEATVTGCRFEGNTAGFGGAIEYGGRTVLRECTFVGNRADEGGAIAAYHGPAIRNCLFAGNRAKTGGAVSLSCSSSSREGFVNCTFCANRADNGNALARADCFHPAHVLPLGLTNCILWDGAPEFGSPADSRFVATAITFSDVLGGWGADNIAVDPCFADPGHWDPNGTPNEPADDFWVNGDYHLKSQAGRWNGATGTWVRDGVTSPCIDGGDPNTPLGAEPFPNGGFVDIGAYGGTAEASQSYFGGPVCETQIAGDINGDCRVDQNDMDILRRHWLERTDFPPTVAITRPADGAEITYPAPIVFEIDAFDPDGTLTGIEFAVENYSGGGHRRMAWSGSVGVGTNHWTYRWDWSWVRADGVHIVWAAATDTEGNRTVSDKIRVTLHPSE